MNRLEEIAPAGRTAQAESGPLLHALQRMSQFALAEGDAAIGGKFGELSAKLGKGLLTVAFCGHFSAGKSTLVNALCGAPLLPSSPIPTSANVVTIRGGAPAARMTFRSKDGAVSEEREIAVADLHGFAVDGEGVASIDVSYPVPLLGDRMAIVDTPGVDSTDSAHRAATESALHLADVVFYVTDYNHVLSDVNFRFLRSLSEWGKPTYVIVNQIDKHREEEVAFPAFRKGLLSAMESWRIEPAGILFLSLREPEHPLSQWNELLRILEGLQPLRTELANRSAERSAYFLAERFRETVRGRQREERERLLGILGEGEEDAGASLPAERESLNLRRRALAEAADLRLDSLKKDLDGLLSNANLTPAETRDKAAEVLESMQPGFKAGWFAGAAKTEAERERRLSALGADFNRQIAANLTGHLKELLRRRAKEAGWDAAEMEASLDAAFRPVDGEWLKDRIKPGIGSGGQATLQYAADLSGDLKAAYRKEALHWNERLEALRKPEREKEESELNREEDALQRREAAAAGLKALDRAAADLAGRLLSFLPAGGESNELQLPQPQAPIVPTMEPAAVEPSSPQANPLGRAEPVPAAEAEYALGASGEAADLLERAAEALSPVPALEKTARNLSAMAARFRDRRFTIALFGAFSAGKSSFANALVGLPALPVSPNPTTATINRIVAPTEDLPDGMARITMKTREAMLSDIRHSLKRLGVSKPDVAAAGDDAARLLSMAVGMPSADVHPKGKPHLAFLQAAANGWSRYGELLDTRFNAEGADYRQYAADEQASCFVAEIDLAVDAPLTRGGAVLVDTPGADSINARHTGVAFEYIKNADAVLFVTYYNHAFTEADRQFLNQLGSVKDVFELDKMFFVLNAADLAASENELQAVKDHVAAQLLKHGIRSPRLFGVSSQNALKAKRSGENDLLESSGIEAFERAFRRFSQEELGAIALASARKEIGRAGKQLDSWLHSATADAATREAKAKRLLEMAEAWQGRSAADVPEAAVQPLWQEASEQLYHLRQRVYFRMGEHFQAAFHPSVLQDDGRDLKKLLAACWDDLRRSVGEDFLQEQRAAGLRLETALGRAADERLASVSAELTAEGFAAENSANPRLELPLADPFSDGPLLESRKLWSYFKSPKHFFENGGAAALKENAIELLFREADERLASLQESWKSAIEQGFRRALGEAYAELSGELAVFARNLGQGMHRPEERTALQEIRERFAGLLPNSVTHESE